MKKIDNGTPTYYLRSSVLGGKVVAEMDWQGVWQRGYVYLGSQLLVVQSGGVPKWVHQDPGTNSQRLTDYNQNVVAAVDVDPWGGETNRSWQQWQQPQRYTSYERDGSGNDQAMHRQYHSSWQRFDQPDPYDGSANMADPQSLNRYAYVQNDPVNFVDPSGLNAVSPGTRFGGCPPGSVVCGSGEGIGAREMLPGFNYIYWAVAEGHASRVIYSFSSGSTFGPREEFDWGPQRPEPQDKRTDPQRNCDNKLSSIFGGVAAGSGYEPTGLPVVGGSYRGGPNGHLNNAAHIYGSENGFAEGDLYIPAGGRYIGRNPRSNEDSYMFYYSQLGNARDVTLVTSHVANFSAPRGMTTGRTNIGDIGGRGGRSISTVGIQNPSGRGTNIHAHLAILKGRGWETGKRLSFFDVFCK